MESIADLISRHQPELIGEKELFHAAVCIPLIRKGNDYDILLQVRSGLLPDQPGDICLPGGALEAGESPREAAVRECCEELLIRPDQLEVIGEADRLHSENLMLYSFPAFLSDYGGSFSRLEVAEVFTVPLSFFMKTRPEEYSVHSKVQPPEDFPYDRIVGGRNYRWRDRTTVQLFYQYKNYTIWGLTAKVLNAFTSILQQ